MFTSMNQMYTLQHGYIVKAMLSGKKNETQNEVHSPIYINHAFYVNFK